MVELTLWLTLCYRLVVEEPPHYYLHDYRSGTHLALTTEKKMPKATYVCPGPILAKCIEVVTDSYANPEPKKEIFCNAKLP